MFSCIGSLILMIFLAFIKYFLLFLYCLVLLAWFLYRLFIIDLATTTTTGLPDFQNFRIIDVLSPDSIYAVHIVTENDQFLINWSIEIHSRTPSLFSSLLSSPPFFSGSTVVSVRACEPKVPGSKLWYPLATFLSLILLLSGQKITQIAAILSSDRTYNVICIWGCSSSSLPRFQHIQERT